MAPISQFDISVAVAIVQERSKLLGRIRELLKAGDEREALMLLKKYLGMSDEQKGDRANTRLN